MGSVSIWQLLIIAAIVVVLFGSRKLRTLGSDLGTSIKGFKKAMHDDTTSLVHADKTSDDADFVAKPITDKQPEAKPEETKSHNKEQV